MTFSLHIFQQIALKELKTRLSSQPCRYACSYVSLKLNHMLPPNCKYFLYVIHIP